MLHDADLHAAVLAAPDDDAPRLVYSDWLLERGDPRGELIAIEVARARLPAGDPRDAELAARRHELWRQHGHAWNAPYGAMAVEHRRGFVEVITGNRDQLANVDLRDACVRELDVWCGDSLAGIHPLLPYMRLRTLGLRLSTTPEVDELAGLLELARVESLRVLGACAPHAGHVQAIAANLADLRALELHGATAEAVGVIASWDLRLRDLRLDGSKLGRGALAPLLGTPAFAALESLHVGSTGIGDVDVAAICASVIPFVELGLSRNALGPAAARAIASTPRFAALAVLGLADTQIGADGLAALLASPHLSTTCQLVLDGELLGLEPDPWLDQGFVIGASWRGHPRPEVAARFRITVDGNPRWDTVVAQMP